VVVLPTVLATTLAAWVLVEALRARRPARAHPDQPAFSVLADGRLPGVVAGLVGGLALGELLAAVAALR
jgi:putative membrane protein